MAHESDRTHRRRRRLSRILLALFIFALFMGPGPGLYLVNPAPNAPVSDYLFAGVPVLYAWALLWFAVEAGIVLAAYLTLWRHEVALPPREAPHNG